MQLSNEAVLAIIAIVATIVGAYAYVLKRQADTALVKANALAEEARTQAEIRKAEAAQATRLIEIIGTSLTDHKTAINQSTERFMQKLDAKQEEVEEKQLTINEYVVRAEAWEKQVVDGLSKLEKAHAETVTDVRKMQEETRSIIHWELVNAVTDSQKQYTQRDIIKLLGQGQGIPFPREHGYTFRKCTVRIKSDKGVNMFPAPLYMDQKPVGRLFDGDEVWIMQDVPFPLGWSAVMAMSLGVKGWVDKAFIAIENCANEALLTPA